MNKIQIVKTTLHHTAGIGGAIIIGVVIKTHVPMDNIIRKVCVPVGAFALGNIVGNACAAEIDRQVDEVVKIFQENKNKNETTETE